MSIKRLALAIALFAMPVAAQTPPGGYGPSTGGSSVSPNTPIPQAQVGPGFNVKNYGAKGDTQATGNVSCTFIGGNAQFTCTGVTFSAATDVTKNLSCSSSNGGASFFGNSLQTIISVQNATTATASTTSGFSASGGCIWGTIDDTAISTAVTAAKAAVKALNGVGNVGIITASPRIYFPAGGYFVCTLLAAGMVNLGSTIDGLIVEGDGLDQTFLYPGGGTACPNSGNSILGSFFNVASGATNIHIGKLTIDGVNGQNSAIGPSMALASTVHLYDLQVQRWAAGLGIYMSGQNMNGERIVVVGGQSVGIQCTGCTGEFRGGGSSNNGTNLLITNVLGSNTGLGFRWFGGLIDECGTNPTACTQVANSNDVWFIGMAAFGTTNAFCLQVDGTSYVHWNGGICGVFGTDNNTSGAKILAGGVLQASDVRFISSGTGKCINNAGIFNDNGGNSCESMFQITSGTSTGTTAVLTLVNAGAAPNTNCTIGDSLLVEGAGIGGYNGYYPAGITATAATTLTYTTAGSNLGALSAGGVAHCRNLQTYTGNLPKALLNNPVPNTCVLSITPIVNATTYQLCEWSAGSATNISRIRAGSQNVTACATAPIITISDGTVSQTLTLTTAKSTWDSSVDASSGVGTTIFKPGGTITVKYDAGALSACATPPTNFRVSYNITPILSN